MINGLKTRLTGGGIDLNYYTLCIICNLFDLGCMFSDMFYFELSRYEMGGKLYKRPERLRYTNSL